MTHIKKTYNLLIGERTAEEIKIKLGSAIIDEKDKDSNDELTTEVRGAGSGKWSFQTP